MKRSRPFLIAFLGILIAVLFGLFIAANTASTGGSFPANPAEVFVKLSADTPLLAYKMNTGSYPATQQGLLALIKAPSGVNNWKGPYMTGNSVPLDPWGTPYHYRSPGLHNPATYDLWSLGPDKLDNTDDDIHNW